MLILSDEYFCSMELSGNEILCIRSLLYGVNVKKVKKKVPVEVLNVLNDLKTRFDVELNNYYEFMNY